MRPSLVIVAGPNGSGKTTATEQLLGHRWLSGHEYINPDRIADARFGGWNDPHAVMEAARWATAERERLLTANENFAFETVFSSDEKLEFTRRAVEAGYFVRFFFIGTSSPDINIRRVATRAAIGGHDVPKNKIIARHARSISLLPLALSVVDRGYVLDNSIDGAPPRLIFRTREGKLAKMYAGEAPKWVTDALAKMASQ